VHVDRRDQQVRVAGPGGRADRGPSRALPQALADALLSRLARPVGQRPL